MAPVVGMDEVSTEVAVTSASGVAVISSVALTSTVSVATASLVASVVPVISADVASTVPTSVPTAALVLIASVVGVVAGAPPHAVRAAMKINATPQVAGLLTHFHIHTFSSANW